jgi:uncharacterized membrane protein
MKKAPDGVRVLLAGEGDLTTLTYQVGWQVSSSNFLLHEDNLQNALSSVPGIDLTRIWGPAIVDDFPRSPDALARYDVLIIGDVGSDTLLLTPQAMSGKKDIDRLKLIQKFVRNGGGLLMCGGYASFGGFRNTGRYHGTPVEEALPVFIKDGDDRIEVVEGFQFSVTDKKHPITANLDWEQAAFFMLGYNRVKAKPDAKILAKYGRDPIAVVWEYTNGRSMAFASDFELHWAGTFVNWKGYEQFLLQAVRWLAKKT